MNKRVIGLISAAPALILAACASASDGSAPLPVAGPDGLHIQQVSVPKLNLSVFGWGERAAQTVKLPSRFERGEDEATPPLANLIIAKAQAAQRVQDRALLKAQQPMQYAEHCHGMDD